MANLYGWQPDPDGVKSILADRDTPVYHVSSSDRKALGVGKTSLRMGTDKKPVVLFDALLPLEPDWNRGAQGIGDCVSWGFELAATLCVATDVMWAGASWAWKGEYATEPIYGGSRVEARGRSRGGWSDGSYGGAAAKWLTKWGALLRIDYSLATSNKEHDLRKYSSNKAKQWGNYGCGGESDKDKLDEVARETPVRRAYLVTSFEDAASAIESGYPVAVCSMQGLGSRDSDGFAPPRGTWAHCMCFSGVRYDKPGLLCTNSWGNSWGTSAPLPGVESNAVKACSAWVDARTCDRMLKQEDSYVLTVIDGLERREIDWSKGWEIHGRN